MLGIFTKRTEPADALELLTKSRIWQDVVDDNQSQIDSRRSELADSLDKLTKGRAKIAQAEGAAIHKAVSERDELKEKLRLASAKVIQLRGQHNGKGIQHDQQCSGIRRELESLASESALAWRLKLRDEADELRRVTSATYAGHAHRGRRAIASVALLRLDEPFAMNDEAADQWYQSRYSELPALEKV